jgi:hypothetical protein
LKIRLNGEKWNLGRILQYGVHPYGCSIDPAKGGATHNVGVRFIEPVPRNGCGLDKSSPYMAMAGF